MYAAVNWVSIGSIWQLLFACILHLCLSLLAPFPLVPHVCSGELGQHWFYMTTALCMYTTSMPFSFSSFPPGATCMQRWTGSALVLYDNCSLHVYYIYVFLFQLIAPWCHMYAAVNWVSIGSIWQLLFACILHLCLSLLAHFPLVPHVCSGELGQHWFYMTTALCMYTTSMPFSFSSFPPGATCMQRWTGSALVLYDNCSLHVYYIYAFLF